MTLWVRETSFECMGKVRDKMAEFAGASGQDQGKMRPKGSINLRIEAQTRQLIDDAAVALGKTRTEFMIDSARAQAIDVLLDRRLFVLDSEHFDAFVEMLDNPPPPDPKLRALMRRRPAWARPEG